MPFTSKAQRAYLWRNRPDVAARFAAKTPPGRKLPARKKPAAKKRKR